MDEMASARAALSAALAAGGRLPWQIVDTNDGMLASIVEENEPTALVALRRVEGVLSASVRVGGCRGFDQIEAGALVEGILAAARASHSAVVALDTPDDLTRYQARRRGFFGSLRHALRYEPLNQIGTEPAVAINPDQLVSDLRNLIPGIRASAHSSRSAFHRLVQSTVSGVGPVTRIEVETANLPNLQLLVPDRPDVMPEQVALAIDTALSIRSRFGLNIASARRIIFDHASHGMASGRVGGQVDLSTTDIHLNAGYCCAELSAQLRAQLLDRRPFKRPSARTTSFSPVEKVIAHEFGHHLDAGFQSSRYRESIRFRMELGRELGVATIEQAIKGSQADASTDEHAAWVRLISEVSAYAATNLQEAMAELFAVWWFRDSNPSPLVKRYGQLMDLTYP